jgi:hypothetical protein
MIPINFRAEMISVVTLVAFATVSIAVIILRCAMSQICRGRSSSPVTP